MKFYTGTEDIALESRLKKVFERVKREKPEASRDESREMYFVPNCCARNYYENRRKGSYKDDDNANRNRDDGVIQCWGGDGDAWN